MKKGRALELLVVKLERLLANSDNVLVESPKRIRDVQTGKFREFDVVLTYIQDHHEIIIAIECRERSRPVGVPEIEAFDNKCRYTNVNQGIVVSSSGFASSAIGKAEVMGIRCLELKEVESASFLMPGAKACIHIKKFLEARYSLIFGESILKVYDDYDIFDPVGNLITDDIIKENIQSVSGSLPFGQVGEERVETVFLSAKDYYVMTKKGNLKHSITGIEIEIKYIHEITESPFTSRSYSFVNKDSLIAEIATAPFSIGDKVKEINVIAKEGGEVFQFFS